MIKTLSKQNWLFALCIPLLFYSCKVNLVSGYDSEIYKQMVETSKKVDQLYIEISDAPADARQYSVFKTKYAEIEVELNSILDQERIRNKNEDEIKECELTLNTFKKYKLDHKTKNTISDADVSLNQIYMKGFFKTMLLGQGFKKKLNN